MLKCVLFLLAPLGLQAQTVPGAGLVGRWDITVRQGDHAAPSWLEVEVSGIKTLVGRYVSTGGSARPISEVHFDNGHFSFSIPPQWEGTNNPLTVQGELRGDGIEGTVTDPSGSAYPFSGVKAPLLPASVEPHWGKPMKLFDGADLNGWRQTGDAHQWFVKDGVLVSPHAGSNLVTVGTFTDFKLHVEFRYPKDGNSGVYLRGRYEVQIEDSPPTAHPTSHLFGGVYGFLTPSVMAALGPDQWQSYDITLVGRMVTVVANGKTIICNQEIPGITGGALDSDEGAPGPIYFQGDHEAVEFRNVILTPANK